MRRAISALGLWGLLLLLLAAPAGAQITLDELGDDLLGQSWSEPGGSLERVAISGFRGRLSSWDRNPGLGIDTHLTHNTAVKF